MTVRDSAARSPLPPPAIAAQPQKQHRRGERARVRGERYSPANYAVSECRQAPLALTLSPAIAPLQLPCDRRRGERGPVACRRFWCKIAHGHLVAPVCHAHGFAWACVEP